MSILEPITNITLDDKTIPVGELPAATQELVQLYNAWREKAIAARNDFLMSQAAVRDVTREISNSVKEWAEAQTKEATDKVEEATDKVEEATDKVEEVVEKVESTVKATMPDFVDGVGIKL